MGGLRRSSDGRPKGAAGEQARRLHPLTDRRRLGAADPRCVCPDKWPGFTWPPPKGRTGGLSRSDHREGVFVVTKNLKKIDTLPLRSGTLGHSVRLDRDFLGRPILKVRRRTGETRYRFKRGDASLAEQIVNALVSETYMDSDDLRSLLETLSPLAADDLRRVLIRDQAGRDAIASRLMRQDQTGEDWADVIDFLTMYPDARRQAARLLGELDAVGRMLNHSNQDLQRWRSWR